MLKFEKNGKVMMEMKDNGDLNVLAENFKEINIVPPTPSQKPLEKDREESNE